MPSPSSALPTGSPPRARGQPLTLSELVLSDRFTPACAGTTDSSTASRAPCSVHPRVRGDNPISVGDVRDRRGSPPRARGQRSSRANFSSIWRFTPACAGTTKPPRRADLRALVHPRVRGDNAGRSTRLISYSGSPPRARGQLWIRLPEPRRGRFTPACAGTTVVAWLVISRSTVHPRVRGDNLGCPTGTSPA